jgi:hypothetical protein
MARPSNQDYKDAVLSQLAEGSGGGDEDHFEHFEHFAGGGAPREHVEAGVGEAFHPDRLPADQAEGQFRDAAAKMKPNERASMMQDMMGQLEQRGLAPSWLQKILGLGSTAPDQASPEDIAKVTEYSRQHQPEVFRKVVADKPFFVRWLDKPLVAGLVGIIAGKLINKAFNHSQNEG